MISLGQFESNFSGQSVLYQPTPDREQKGLRGHCVQLACFYVEQVWGLPVIWADAYEWYKFNTHSDKYDRTAFNGSNRPPVGALVVWGPDTPNSGRAGHIAICIAAPVGAATFVSLDQNWGGKYVHRVTHNWTNVVGWLTPKAAAVVPQKEQDMPISSGALDRLIKGMLGREPTATELNDMSWRTNPELGIVTLWEFGGKQRYAEVQAKQAEVVQTINELNLTITKMRAEDLAEDQRYIDKIALLTADLTTAQDELKDLRDRPITLDSKAVPQTADVAQSTTPKASWLTKFLAKLIDKQA